MSKINVQIIRDKDEINISKIFDMIAISYRSYLGRVTQRTPFKGIAFRDKNAMKKHIDILIQSYEKQFGEKYEDI